MLHLRWQQVGQLAVGERCECLRCQVPEPALLNAFRRRVNRRQRIHDRLLVRGVGKPVLGMNDLEPDGSAADLAEAAQASAARELLLLGASEVEEPERQESRAVGQPHKQRAAPAKDDFGELDFALDRDAHLRSQRADRHDMRTVLVAVGQQEQEIGDSLDAEFCKAAGERRADAGEHSHRPCPGCHGTSMQSTSIAAPRGSEATPIVTRAGYGSLKYSAMIVLATGNCAKSVR